MSLSKFLCSSLLLCGTSATAFACEYPALPSIPADGRISNRVERTVNEDMVRYVTEMSVYVACVQAEHSAAVSDGISDLSVSLLADRNNAAVAELEAVRELYEDRVGPLEELFFELPFDSGDRRGDAAPRRPSKPTGSDTVIRRAEIIRGALECGDNAVCSKTFSKPGEE